MNYYFNCILQSDRAVEGILDQLDTLGLMDNLAVKPREHGELLLAMNDKMNQLIETEVGEPGDGNFLPGEDVDWAATTFDP